MLLKHMQFIWMKTSFGMDELKIDREAELNELTAISKTMPILIYGDVPAKFAPLITIITLETINTLPIHDLS